MKNEMIDTKIHLCDNCMHCFAECDAKEIVFGNGVGNDNVIICDRYEAQPTDE